VHRDGPLQVHLGAGHDRAEAGALERLGHQLHAERAVGAALGVDDGEADAVDGDRVAVAGVGGDRPRADGEHHHVRVLPHRGDLADLLDDPGEHARSPFAPAGCNPPGSPFVPDQVQRWADTARTRSRSASTARAGSSAPYTAEPATQQSTPASAGASMVSALMPPSISMRSVRWPVSTSRRAVRTFSRTSGMTSWPPKPGSTLITSSVS